MPKTWPFLGGTVLPLLLVMPAMAQDMPAAANESGEAGSGEPVRATDIVVNGTIAFRNRTDDPNPVLSYDLEYFQRFEPVSVGEMLKRVPGVTFTSDVLEYDGVQMRGLPPGFTKVLINGKRPPGGESDRSFFVDRIPAELVERIEIVRSPTADQSSEGVAGTLNVITKDAARFEGGFAKAGMLINEDGGVRPSGAIAYADTIGQTSFWGAVNYQKRRNPKKKVSDRFDGDLFFNNRELQDDTRDGSDLSANAEITTAIGEGKLRLRGLYVDTNRDEDETSLTYELAKGKPEDFGKLFRPRQSDLELDGVELQHEDISQQTYALNLDFQYPVGPGEIGIEGAWNGFRENTTTRVLEGDTLAEAELDGIERLRTHDDEYQGTVYYRYKGDTLRIKLGVDYLDKSRRGSLREEDEDGLKDPASGALYRIKERRYDPYIRFTYEPSAALTVDAGLRYEITRRKVRTNADEQTTLDRVESFNDESLNPSLSVRYAPTSADLFRFSVARTLRRPDYDLIAPSAQREEPSDDNALVGNPRLKNQQAWGIDLGYERRIGRNGILGVNLFYRDIKNLIELTGTTDTIMIGGDEYDVVTPANVGDGEAWGVEVDFSTPLTVIGLPDTGIFANYTYLDSKLTDFHTGEKRRFNNQPRHVYNIGFIQTLRSIDASFGASISGRTKAFESRFDETVDLRYGADLEAFVEKRIGKHFVLRFSAQNLLNRSKREAFNKWDGDSLDEILENRRTGNLDEFELERERSGRLFQLTMRAAF